MLTLYKRKGAVIYFWRAWVDGTTLHSAQGEVGGAGLEDRMPFSSRHAPEEVLRNAAREPRADGFQPLDSLPPEHLTIHLAAGPELEALLDRLRQRFEQTGLGTLEVQDAGPPTRFIASVPDRALATRATLELAPDARIDAVDASSKPCAPEDPPC